MHTQPSLLRHFPQILLAENTIPEPENPRHIKKFEHEIEFRNVSFRYADKWILRNINLTIPKGKTIAIVGQSGGGKSTLVDLIPRYYDVQELTVKYSQEAIVNRR